MGGVLNLWREFFDSADLRIKLRALKLECNGLREDIAKAHVEIKQMRTAETQMRDTIILLTRKGNDQTSEIANLKHRIKQLSD